MGRPCLCVQRASGQVNGALVSSREHSVSLFFSVRSLTRPVNLSLSVNFSFHSGLKLFPTVSIYFHLIASCLPSFSPFSVSCPISFLSSSSALSFSAFLSPSLCLCLQLFLSLLSVSSAEQTSLKYQKTDQEASLLCPFLLTLPPSF